MTVLCQLEKKNIFSNGSTTSNISTEVFNLEKKNFISYTKISKEIRIRL